MYPKKENKFLWKTPHVTAVLLKYLDFEYFEKP